MHNLQKKTKILKTNLIVKTNGEFTSICEHEFGRIMIHMWRTCNYVIWNYRKENEFLKTGQAERLRSARSWQVEHSSYKPLSRTCRHK